MLRKELLELQTGDMLSETERDYVDALERLWDMLSDCVEGGRLTEGNLPDDYAALVRQMVKLTGLEAKAFKENQE